MIQELIDLIIAHVRVGLAGEFNDLNSRVVRSPMSNPTLSERPKWGVEAKALRFQQSMTDDGSGTPRPVAARARIAVNPGKPAGPYPFGNQPLVETVEMKVIYDEGLVTERSETLLPGIDFSVDAQVPNFTVSKDIAGADVLRVSYSYVGISSVREFEQQFEIQFFAAGWNDFDKWVGLAAAVVQSRHAQLIDQFNFQNPTHISLNGFVSNPTIHQIKLRGIEPLPPAPQQALTDLNWVMHYSVTGQLLLGESLSGGFGLIESVHTPAQSGPGINIVPDLG